MKKAAVGLAIALIIALCLRAVFFPREIVESDYEVVARSGRALHVHLVYSNTKVIGHADLFMLGGGSPKYVVTVSADGSEAITWRGTFGPVIVDESEGRIFVSTFGHQGAENAPAFAFYVSDGSKWQRLRASDFPKSIAVRNIGTSNSESGGLRAALLNPAYRSSDSFRQSLTARLWLCLDQGLEYWDVRNRTIPGEFVASFYQREIADEGPKAAQPGATDNPDDAQRLRDDH